MLLKNAKPPQTQKGSPDTTDLDPDDQFDFPAHSLFFDNYALNHLFSDRLSRIRIDYPGFKQSCLRAGKPLPTVPLLGDKRGNPKREKEKNSKMPYLSTPNAFLEQSSLLLEAYPDDVRHSSLFLKILFFFFTKILHSDENHHKIQLSLFKIQLSLQPQTNYHPRSCDFYYNNNTNSDTHTQNIQSRDRYMSEIPHKQSCRGGAVDLRAGKAGRGHQDFAVVGRRRDCYCSCYYYRGR